MANAKENKNQAFKLKQIYQTQQLSKWMTTKQQATINDLLQLLHKGHRLAFSSIAKISCVILSSFHSLERNTSQACKAYCL
jgi:capsule polysaccharide export protein KpsE/RkpR